MAGVTATTAAALIPSRWSASLRLDATEEMVIGSHFNDGEGVEKIMGTLYVRRVKGVAAASQGAGGTPAYTGNTEVALSGSPTWATGAVQIDRSVYNRMDQSPENPYRKQIAAGLGAYIDVQCGILAASLSTNQSGGAGSNLSYDLVTELIWKVIASSKNHFKAGQTPAWLCIHPAQGKYLVGQMNFIADYIRGDGETPAGAGWVIKGAGFNMLESGNVYQSAGVTYNIAYSADAFVLAYNEEPTVLEPQPFDATMKIIGTTEFLPLEVYDEYAGVLLTAA